MPELVTVENAEDLMPLDMLEEGRAIMSIHFGSGLHIETGMVRRGHDHLDDGTFYWFPIWTDQRDEPYPEFPVTVLRPAPIPDGPCEVCGTKASDVDQTHDA